MNPGVRAGVSAAALAGAPWRGRSRVLSLEEAPRGRGAKEFVRGHTAGPAHAKPCALLGPPLCPCPRKGQVRTAHGPKKAV